MFGYLDDIIRPLVLILPEMSEHVRTFEDKNRDKDKGKNNKLMSFRTDNDKLLNKYQTIWSKIETGFDKWALYYDRIDLSEGSDVTKSNNSKEYAMVF